MGKYKNILNELESCKKRYELMSLVREHKIEIPNLELIQTKHLKMKIRKKIEELVSNEKSLNKEFDITKENLDKIEIIDGTTYDIDISNLVVYENADITIENNFVIYSQEELYPTAYLKNKKGEICAELSIEKVKNKKYLVATKENIDFRSLTGNFCEVIVFPMSGNVGYSLKTTFKLKKEKNNMLIGEIKNMGKSTKKANVFRKEDIDKIEIIDGTTYDIDVSNLVVYENADITIENNFVIYSQEELYPTAYLKNKKGEICAELSIEKVKNKKYLVATKENIDFRSLTGNFCEVIVFPMSGNVGYSLKTTFKLKEYEAFKGTLCIDFGTSNTSLGTYFAKEDKIVLVKFRDVLNSGIERDTIPTIVYVENCANPNNIEYKFGYEAKKEIKDKNYTFVNTLFYEIKRWLINIEKEEILIDADYNEVSVKRKDIIKAYLEYLIKEASNQLKVKFDKIHFSTPINLKGKYINSLKKILPEYNILSEDKSIDEGVAVIYDEIATSVIENRKNGEYDKDIEKKKVLTIDVGGGTTDVISSTYSLKDDEKGTNLEIVTYPENSNTSFGGNNLTYRIFQYLKIKIVDNLVNENKKNGITIDDLIKLDRAAILESIDKNGAITEVYSHFDAAYKKATEILPTNFRTNIDFETNKLKQLLKRNFYLLWEAAEIIKIEFFKKSDIFLIDFLDEDEDSKKIKIPTLENLYFSIVYEGNLTTLQRVPKILLSINEIQKLIYGDIYKVIRDIFVDKGEVIDEYRKVKLSGQTCNIGLFHDLLKEFIAGKYLRTKSVNDGLKLNCIKGSIRYTADIDTGIIVPNIIRIGKDLKHRITVVRHQEENVLSSEGMKVQNFDKVAKLAKINVYDSKNNFVKREVYELTEGRSGESYLIKEILESFLGTACDEIKQQIKEELSNIESETKALIFYPLRDGYTFKVLEFLKLQNNTFVLLNSQTYTYDQNFDETKFFNGED